MKVEFVDSQREKHGVQPVLQALEQTPAQIAPCTYYAARTRPESTRAATDRVLVNKIEQVYEDNYSVYGARKVWAELNRRGTGVARCTVERLMRQAGLRGLCRDKSPRTTRPVPETHRPADLVERDFTATGPNELWVADLTYVRTAAGWVYAAFVLDVFSRLIVGWQVATSLYTDLVLDALQMAIWRRQATGTDLAGARWEILDAACVVVTPAGGGTFTLGGDRRRAAPPGNRLRRTHGPNHGRLPHVRERSRERRHHLRPLRTCHPRSLLVQIRIPMMSGYNPTKDPQVRCSM